MVVFSRAALFVVLAALLYGCSTVRFAYENADAYLRWKVATYLDLEGEDAERLDDLIDELHEWHRRNALPKYVTLAHEASRRIAGGLSREDVVWGYDSARMQARESLRKAGELAAPLLDRLTPEQLAHVERRLAEENRKFYRENLRGSERERRKKRARMVQDRLEDWVGSLTREQVKTVREYAERAPMADELRERDRKRLQQDVIAIIRARQAGAKLPERLANWERGREPAYVAALDAWREQYFTMLLDVDRSLTPEQRGRVTANLRRYAEEFEALAAR